MCQCSLILILYSAPPLLTITLPPCIQSISIIDDTEEQQFNAALKASLQETKTTCIDIESESDTTCSDDEVEFSIPSPIKKKIKIGLFKVKMFYFFANVLKSLHNLRKYLKRLKISIYLSIYLSCSRKLKDLRKKGGGGVTFLMGVVVFT